MGQRHSSSAQDSKTNLADKRYQVHGIRSIRRRSTRKMGNVTLSGCDMQPADHEVNTSSVECQDRSGVEECEPSMQEMQEAQERSGVDERLLALYPQQNQQSRQAPKQTAASSSKRPGLRSGETGTSHILLTRTERVLIENSWKRSRKVGVESVGSRIFLRVLNAQPDIKFLFGLEKIPQGRLKYDPIFRKHASLLTTTLTYIVKNLSYPEKLAQHFQALGRKHCKAQAKAFKNEYWDCFEEIITQCGLESEQGNAHKCRETIVAWRNLINFIVNQMRKGFDEERALRKRFSASLMGISRSSTASVNTTHSNPTCSPYATITERSISAVKPVVGRIQRGAKSGSVPKSVSYLNFETDETELSPAGAPKLAPAGAARPGCLSSSPSSSARSASWCPEMESTNGENGRTASVTGGDGAGYFTPAWSPVLGSGTGRHHHSLSISTVSVERRPPHNRESRRRSSGRGVLEKRYASLPTCEFLCKRDNTHGDYDGDDESICTAGVELRVYDEYGSLSTAASALQLDDELGGGDGEGGEDMFATPKASTTGNAPFGIHRHSAGSIINHHRGGDGLGTDGGGQTFVRSPSSAHDSEMSSSDANRRLSAQ